MKYIVYILLLLFVLSCDDERMPPIDPCPKTIIEAYQTGDFWYVGWGIEEIQGQRITKSNIRILSSCKDPLDEYEWAEEEIGPVYHWFRYFALNKEYWEGQPGVQTVSVQGFFELNNNVECLTECKMLP